ncbi:MAG: ABC transporter ATP-binding protein [Clostridium sp.]
MINITNLSKSFGNKNALSNVDLNVEKGTVVGLVGAHGAGKSTLLRCLVDIYKPDSGETLINGESIFENVDLKEKIGYVADKNDYFNKYKVKEIIKYYKLAYKNFSEERFNELNAVFEIPLKKKLSKLSKGNISRVHFMLALSICPEVLILDEPTTGLDPIVKRKFMKILLDEVYERKTTVIISSHNLSDLETICDKVVFIDKGKVVEDSSVETLKGKMKKIQVIFKGDCPENFEKWNGVLNVVKIGKSYNLIVDNFGEDLTNKLVACGALFIEELDLSLEDMMVYKLGN